MRQGIDHGGLLGDQVISGFKLRQQINQPIVPAEFALVHQQRQCRGGQGGGCPGQGKQGVRINGQVTVYLPGIAFGQQSLAVFYHGDGQAGHLPLVQGLLDRVI